jgi:hypothetical protein
LIATRRPDGDTVGVALTAVGTTADRLLAVGDGGSEVTGKLVAVDRISLGDVEEAAGSGVVVAVGAVSTTGVVGDRVDISACTWDGVAVAFTRFV